MGKLWIVACYFRGISEPGCWIQRPLGVSLTTSATTALSVTMLAWAVWTPTATAATEPEKQAAIQSGLRYLYQIQQVAGTWKSSGQTGAAVFGFLSQRDKWHENAALYQATIEKAVTFLLNAATVTTVNARSNNVNICPSGRSSCRGIYWEGGGGRVHTTGLVAPALALYGAQRGAEVVATTSGPLADLTWSQIAQGITNALAANQNTDESGDRKRGWRYSFSSQAQLDAPATPWAVVSLLYNETLGAITPEVLKEDWKASVETAAGEFLAGCSQPSSEPCEHSEVGAWLLAMNFVGYETASPRVQAALAFLNGYWKSTATSARDGNFGRAEAMWMVYQALERTVGLSDTTHISNLLTDCGATVGGRPRDPASGVSCTWSEDYSHWLVKHQKVNGSWTDDSDRVDPIGTALFVSVLGATRLPQARYQCPFSRDTWKQTPGAWPVAALLLGDQMYTKQELLAILSASEDTPSLDASVILANELIAAKLNLARGADPKTAARIIADADRLLSGFNGKLPNHVPPLTVSGEKMIEAAKALNDHNKLLTVGCVSDKHLSPGGAPERFAPNTPSLQSVASPAATGQLDSATARMGVAETTTALAVSPARLRSYVRKGVTGLAVNANGSTLASASTDNRIRLWDATTGQQRGVLSGALGLPTALAFSDGAVLAGVGRDSVLRVWDAASGQELAKLSGHEHAIRTVAVSRDGRFLATAGEESRILLWDLTSKRLSKILFGHTDFVNALAFSPDGRILASGGEDARVRIFDVATGRSLYTLGGHVGPIDAVAFSPDGAILATGGQDTVVYLWNAATGRQRQALKGHGAPIRTIAFSPDGQSIASGAEDTLIILWKLATETMDKILFGSTGTINMLGFDPRGTFLASATDDGNLTLWNVPAGARMRVIRVP